MMEISDIRRKDEDINAFISFAEDPQEGAGVLSEKTIAIKSNICVEGMNTTCASKTLEDYVAPYDATVVEKVEEAGACIVGMANMDEFACGSSGENSYYGATKNPACTDRVAGGSSSGPAAAVAAGFVDFALGSDTGGSIRTPASNCGVVGYKPTYGTVSRYGLIDMAMSLDQIGPIAATVRDCALLFDVITGYDGRDSTSIKDAPTGFLENLNPDMEGVKLGYAKEFEDLISDEGIRASVKSSIEGLASMGAEVVEVSLPNLEIALPTYYLNMYVEFYSATRKYDGRRYGHRIEDVCGEEVLRRILLGKYISQKEYSGKYYRKALKARSLIRADLNKALEGVDALVGPVVPKLPHKLGEDVSDPRTMYAYDIFTVLANLAGLPAGSVPSKEVDSVPTGLHVMGAPLKDQAVLNVMAAAENG